MDKILAKILSLCLLLATLQPLQAATLIHNVNGYSLNQGELQRFVALEYEQGKVTRLYGSALNAERSSAATRIDAGGATLLPGLIDAHGHVSGHGRALSSVDLLGVTSEQQAVQRVASYLAQHPASEWVQGRGWNQVLWPEKTFPNKASLDAISADSAVVLTRVDGHALWANSKALALAGISASSPDPEGGQIVRDSKGQPTGVLIDNAMTPMHRVMPQASVEQLAQWQYRALEDLASYGITSVHDAGVSALEVQAYRVLQRAGRLPIRVYAMLDLRDPGNDVYLEAGPSVDQAHRLDVRSVKIWVDGALGSRGAALFEDYSDAPGERGLLLQSAEALEQHMNRAVAAGYQVSAHAIGDRANTRVLDLYERLNSDPKSAALRHRVEHAQVLRRQDIARFPALNVIASIQPLHAISDKNMAGARLGKERLQGAYAWQSLLASASHMAAGSDVPAESPNPFLGLHAAVSRQDQSGEPNTAWMPEQKISRLDALALFTEGAAYAAHQEAAIGRLQPGYFADFILIDKDYFEVPEAELGQLQVKAVYVAGKQVYQAPRFR